MREALTLDAAGFFPERIGRAGMPPAAFKKNLRACAKILAQIQKERCAGAHAFLDLPAARGPRREILRFAREQAGRYDTVLVLGIGGSALGTTAVAAALRPSFGEARGVLPHLVVLDNIDPEWLAGFLSSADLARTLVCIVSKSGGTPETAAQFLWLADVARRTLGGGWHKRFVVVTDPEKGPLRRIAQEEKLASFAIPPAVGGRYSVLSPACLVPLALCGVDIEGLARGAAAMEKACRRAGPGNPTIELAAALHHFYSRGRRIVVMMPYAQKLLFLADWYAQLLGESLGKRVDRAGRVVHAGFTPVRALGATDQHSQLQLYAEGPHDKVILFLAVEKFAQTVRIPKTEVPGFAYLSRKSFSALLGAEREGTARALAEAGRPTATIRFPRVTPETVGQFLLLMELKVAMLGFLLDVDPYDQPGVERGKILAREILKRSR